MKKKLLSLILMILSSVLTLAACSGSGDKPYRVIETLGQAQYCAAFRADDPVADEVCAALSVLAADGTIASLSQQWIGEDLSCLSGDKNALEKLESRSERTSLIIGVEEEFRPLSYSDGGEYMGFTVDLARRIGALLGWDIRIQPMAASELTAQLVSGNVDCALGFDTEGADVSKLRVGECYMESSIVLASLSDGDVKHIRDLKDLKIGAVKGTSAVSAAASSEKAAKYAQSITAYLSPLRCINALREGWCAAIAMDEIMLEAYFR